MKTTFPNPESTTPELRGSVIERRNDSKAWRYIFRTHGVNVDIQGPFIDVDASNLSKATEIAKRCVTSAWNIELKSATRY